MTAISKWLRCLNLRRFGVASIAIVRNSLLLILCFLGWASSAQAVIPASERAVLTALFASTNGAAWTNKTNWNSAPGTECTWYGVTCNGTQTNVAGIFLGANNLSGTLPGLSALTALQTFDVFGNQLTGTIPALSGMAALRFFYVDHNNLSGSIPTLAGLTALTDFYVHNNALTGPIPTLSGLTALQFFLVSRNQLSGPVPAPPSSLVAGQSDLCINSLTSSGNPAIDAAWVTAQSNSAVPGGNWLACQTVSAPPACTLNASPSSIFQGGTAILTASCSPAATSYTWTGGTCAGTIAATCTVTPSNTTAYTVRGTNAIGVGNTAGTTVTVTLPAPVCTLTASPSSINSGSSSTLTASCSNAPTTYIWTGGTCAGTTCVVAPLTTTTYSVAGVNSAGAGPAAFATVVVTPPTSLFCTLTASPTSINPGGTSTLSTACNSPVSFLSWTGGTCAGTNAPTCTVKPSTTTVYTVTASTASSSYTANATVTVSPPTAVPSCELVVSPAAIAAGRSSTLTASCSPSATAFSWTGGTCVGTVGPTCAVTPAVNTTYTVRGSNAVGIGNVASGTVTIVAPIFPLTVTSSITPAVANVTAEIRLRPQDATIPQNVYVFALAPASLVNNIPTAALVDHKGPVTRSLNTADTPTACVLAQLINGELTFVDSTASLKAFLSGVLGSLGQSVSVLKEVSTSKVGGAIFFVGYGTSASAMISGGTSQNVVEVPGANACQPQAPQTGWWWYPLQDGRGFGIEVQGRKMFMSGYLYDSTGHATWVVAEGEMSIDSSLFSGNLYQVANGQSLTGAYKKPAVSAENPGPITLTFKNARNGTLIWNGGIIPIQRFDDIIGSGNGVTPSFVPENGWWWNSAEDGRGYFIELKNNYAFIAGYMYEADGRPVWYIAEGKMSTPQSFSSTWYQAGNGQTLTGPYKKPSVVNINVGSISIQFQTATRALLTLPDGRQITITRQLYGL